MNIKYITFLFSCLLLFLLFPSCGDNDTTTDYTSSSKDAQIYSFSITAIAPISEDSVQRAQDSIRFIRVGKTKFAIDQVAGVIYNPDSLMYGTVLDSVKVAITFNGSYQPAKVLVTTPDSVNGYVWNLEDSISFAKLPVKLTVTSPSGNLKTYNIDIRTHKIDPDTLLWKQMTSYPSTFGESKTLLLKDSAFYTYGISGSSALLYTSSKSSTLSWTKQTLSGFSSNVKPESIFLMNGVFYALDQTGNSYSSAKGLDWKKLTTTKTLTSILGVLPAANRADDQLLVTYNNGGKYYFGKTKDLITITEVSSISVSPYDNQVPSNFPLQKAASYTSITTNKNKRMLILTAGISSGGVELPYTWLIKDSDDGLEMSPFIKNTLFKGAGLSNFVYGDNLYALSNNQFYISVLWGELWTIAPNKQKFDPAIAARTGQTAIVDANNFIWIFGGVSEGNKGLSDVWRGRLNSLIP
ncbi:hypothetical protein CLV62_11732 [Dysgonomonas alginatilytica]|uniref:Uncharacterized protein n=1 Tax=Dysgonomonas alginatilytica TaxID=1605892 RepID=A0A2V3PP86_9BACT|nr:DUF6242 domain-containing protein [Dysgonomonas alginatilytica]PXV62816.1 hypothetical protein CLV62_11732 [Dysgonomonas alginatilytica]